MTAVDADPGGPPAERAAGTAPGTPGVPARPASPARPAVPARPELPELSESAVLPELRERPELPDRPLLDPAGLLAPVAELGTELRYTQLHEVTFVGCPDCREWDEWLRRSARRGLGQAALPPTARAARPAGGHSGAPHDGGPRSAAVGGPFGEGHRHRRRAAVAVLGLGVAELRRRCQRHGWPRTVGVFAPVRDQVRNHVIAHLTAWRTNLHTPPRAKQPARVWAGADGNPLVHATVAESVPRDVQEVRGVVLHSGPPAGEETATGEGSCR